MFDPDKLTDKEAAHFLAKLNRKADRHALNWARNHKALTCLFFVFLCCGPTCMASLFCGGPMAALLLSGG